jgi:hypothetical protein
MIAQVLELVSRFPDKKHEIRSMKKYVNPILKKYRAGGGKESKQIRYFFEVAIKRFPWF